MPSRWYNSIMNIRHPARAVGIYLGIGFFLHIFGLHDGTFYIVDIIIGILIYKAFSNH